MHTVKNKFHHLSAGYTIVELLMFMGLFSMFLVLLTNMFATILETQQRSLATSYVEQTGRFVLSRLLYDIHQADVVVTPASLGDETSTLELQISGADHTYALTGSNLVLTDDEGAYVVNADQVTISNFLVRRIGNVGGKPTLQFSFDVNSTIPDTTGIQSRNFSTTVGLR